MAWRSWVSPKRTGAHSARPGGRVRGIRPTRRYRSCEMHRPKRQTRTASAVPLNAPGGAADTGPMDSASTRSDERASVSIAEVFSALSFALDITEGHPLGHALRTCLIGMRLADRMGLSLTDRRDLYYALMLKDVGCSSNAARVFELFGGDE